VTIPLLEHHAGTRNGNDRAGIYCPFWPCTPGHGAASAEGGMMRPLPLCSVTCLRNVCWLVACVEIALLSEAGVPVERPT